MDDQPWITIIGCGPGSADFVTPAARRACADAAVTVGARRSLALFPEFEGERIVMKTEVQSVLDAIEEIGGKKRVAVLVTGDVGLNSLAGAFIRRFGRRACRLVPGVSSIQAAFAGLGLEWAGCEILSAHHGRPKVEIDHLKTREKIAVLAGSKSSLLWIASIFEGLRHTHAAFACEDLTLETEKIRPVDAMGLRLGEFSTRTVVLILRKGLVQ